MLAAQQRISSIYPPPPPPRHVQPLSTPPPPPPRLHPLAVKWPCLISFMTESTSEEVVLFQRSSYTTQAVLLRRLAFPGETIDRSASTVSIPAQNISSSFVIKAVFHCLVADVPIFVSFEMIVSGCLLSASVSTSQGDR